MDPELIKAARALLLAQQRARAAGVALAPADQDAYVREETRGRYGLQHVQKLLASIDTGIGPRNLARSAVQGASFDFGDEILGVLPEALGGGEGAKAEMRLRQDLFRQQHPIADAAAGFAGALAVPGIAGGALARGAEGVGAAALRGMAVGAGAGAAQGAGAAETMADVPGRALRGAAVGGVLGAALPTVVGGARLAFSPAARAQRRLGASIARSGGLDALRTTNAAVAAAGRGEQAIVGDMSDHMRQMTDFAANADVPTYVTVKAITDKRGAGASERILDDVRSAVGNPEKDARLAELAESRRTFADPAYDALRKQHPNIPLSPRLEAVLEQPLVRAALAQAQQHGLVGDVPDLGNPSVAHLLDVRRALKSQADRAFRAGDGTLGQGLKEAKQTVEQELSDHVPGWEAVNAEYARRKGLERAVEQGADWFHKADSRGLARVVADMTAAERDEFRKGMASELIAQLSSVKTNRDAAKGLMDASPAMQRKLETVFGSEAAFRRFMQRTEIEAELAKMKGVIGGSATARRTMAADADPLETGAEALIGGPAGLPGLAARTMSKMGKGAVARRTAAQLGPYATIQGTSAIEAFLRRLQEHPFRVIGPTLSGAMPAAMPQAFGNLFDQ